MEEIKLQSVDTKANTFKALQMFASTLTDRVRELDRLEREWKIDKGESTKILTSMIESYVYSVIQAMKRVEAAQPQSKEEVRANAELISKLAQDNVINGGSL